MILKTTLKEIVQIQKKEIEKSEATVPREILPKLDTKSSHALIISGIRRCGKSTLLRQLMQKIPEPNYLNFEDPKLINFEATDFEKLDETFEEINGKSESYFLDEIQNIAGWERFVRKYQDAGKKFSITGSNASLLSRELGTKLTGRHLSYELFPFSYNEMLALKGKKPSKESFHEYMEKGGFPEYLKHNDDAILQQVLRDILARDIVVRYKLRNVKVIEQLALYLMANIGKEISYNQLAKLFSTGSVNTIADYISYFEQSYLLFCIPKFDYSYKKQLVNPKKIYAIDPGLARANSVSFSKDKGRVLENTIFLHLRRNYKDIYYYKGKKECDFLVKEKGKITRAIQVCYELNEENQDREINGLKEAMEEHNLNKGTIITLTQKDKLGNITILPAWEWASK